MGKAKMIENVSTKVFGRDVLENAVASLGTNGLNLPSIERSIRSYPSEIRDFKFLDGTYLIVYRDKSRRTNIAERSQDPYRERVIGRYEWQFPEDEMEDYRDRIAQLIHGLTVEGMNPEIYAFAVEQVNGLYGKKFRQNGMVLSAFARTNPAEVDLKEDELY